MSEKSPSVKFIWSKWKELAKYLFQAEIFYQENYRKYNNKKRKEMRINLDNLTIQMIKLRNEAKE